LDEAKVEAFFGHAMILSDLSEFKPEQVHHERESKHYKRAQNQIFR
jgi:hypothetical protein